MSSVFLKSQSLSFAPQLCDKTTKSLCLTEPELVHSKSVYFLGLQYFLKAVRTSSRVFLARSANIFCILLYISKVLLQMQYSRTSILFSSGLFLALDTLM